MKNTDKLLLEDLYRIIEDFQRPETNRHTTVEQALIRIAGLLVRLVEHYDRLNDRCAYLDGDSAD